ncbi:MAG: exodeoxyribonuclease VII large subunit, partial [Rudaea sp.]
LQAAAQRVDQAYTRLRAQHPRARLRLGGERLAQLHARLQSQHPRIRLAHSREPLQALRRRLHATTARQLESGTLRLNELARTLNAVSPLATLQRGYTIVLERESGHVVRTAEQARTIECFDVRFADGGLPLRRDD